MSEIPHHVRLLDTSNSDDFALIRSRNSHPSNPVRWVEVGGKAFGFTPDTVYTGLLSTGEPYYPYYDKTLCDIPIYDLADYTLGNTTDITDYIVNNDARIIRGHSK